MLESIKDYLWDIITDYDTFVGVALLLVLLFIPSAYIKFVVLAAGIYLIVKPSKRPTWLTNFLNK